MDIRVSGHQIETGAALQDHVSDRLNNIVEKYFGNALSSHVTFGKAPAGAFSCDIVAHVMQGMIVKGHAEAQDAHQALRPLTPSGKRKRPIRSSRWRKRRKIPLPTLRP